MILDSSNYKDKNKGFSKKENYVNSNPGFVHSVVEKRNNYLKNIKNSTIAKTGNPFTNIGLLIAIINDLNDLRKKVEVMEMNLFSQNTDNFNIKEVNLKND